ncbi:MAG: COX15/CtaA family protein [Lewinellaceae bacterium]|nr:COX15/CtaA family protein [Lewinellaceae bacterium]
MRYPKSVQYWLLAGLVMIFFQVVLGGITRLTGSGLSITKWDIVTGTLPPVGNQQWQEAFELYKATPQYQKINQGMELSQFKFIFFWEYFHRLWARLMGFVFLFPLIYFLIRRYIDRALMVRLVVVFLLAALVASVGWIMVASGLIDRPWVNAYNLTIHLSFALILFSYLAWTYWWTVHRGDRNYMVSSTSAKWLTFILVILGTQLILGGMMSGMKAGLLYPTWPDMRGTFIPDVLKLGANWQWSHFTQYDDHEFMGSLVQWLHRGVAYLLALSLVFFWFKSGLKASSVKMDLIRSGFLVLLQITLGIFTVIHCVGYIPLWLGVAHQSVALLLLLSLLHNRFRIRTYNAV